MKIGLLLRSPNSQAVSVPTERYLMMHHDDKKWVTAEGQPHIRAFNGWYSLSPDGTVFQFQNSSQDAY
jgi:hypothetical protein